MNDAMTDGRLQVTAAVALLKNSKLVHWIPKRCEFVPVTLEAFESSWQRDVDPDFGRVICWISFAAGAEFLAKGTCLVRGVEIRTDREVPTYPTTGIASWVPQFRESWKSAGTMMTTHFGTLYNLTCDKSDVPSALSRLCSTAGATAEEKDLLFAGYDLLRKSIRNRDAHAYIPNVRESHFNVVPELFTRCFNVLTSWLPGGPSILNQWRMRDIRS